MARTFNGLTNPDGVSITFHANNDEKQWRRHNLQLIIQLHTRKCFELTIIKQAYNQEKKQSYGYAK